MLQPTSINNAKVEREDAEDTGGKSAKAADARGTDAQAQSEVQADSDMTGMMSVNTKIERIQTTTMPTAPQIMSSREDTAKNELAEALIPEGSNHSSGLGGRRQIDRLIVRTLRERSY